MFFFPRRKIAFFQKNEKSEKKVQMPYKNEKKIENFVKNVQNCGSAEEKKGVLVRAHLGPYQKWVEARVENCFSTTGSVPLCYDNKNVIVLNSTYTWVDARAVNMKIIFSKNPPAVMRRMCFRWWK